MRRVRAVSRSVKGASRLRAQLAGDPAELYDYVLGRYPCYADRFLERRGAQDDFPFRNLLRAVIEDAPEPRRWHRMHWPDAEVVHAASDPETRRRAWGLLAQESPWRQQWVKKNRDDRRQTIAIRVGFVVVFLCGLAWILVR